MRAAISHHLLKYGGKTHFGSGPVDIDLAHDAG